MFIVYVLNKNPNSALAQRAISRGRFDPVNVARSA